MEASSTARITCSYLDSYVGKNVIVVGKVVQIRGDEAVIDADGNITAHLNRECHLAAGNGVQIIGKVNPDLSVKVLSSLDLGTNVDLSLANLVAEVSHQNKDMFIYD
ncbi:replication factor A protein 3 [Lasiosphaeria ovina]|uniref:Replication factor A protein 3 n=1 Tax=Lasiosphaeria ovina TaxID=92902 RepID=A0AAE0N827_9PEZI|nr:replication factor A protein 3 [Lasiosphaeria ovina]